MPSGGPVRGAAQPLTYRTSTLSEGKATDG